jgi:hypothetical protein
MKSENKECLGHLFLVNPQDAMTAIERDEEGGLVDDAYEWILKGREVRHIYQLGRIRPFIMSTALG